MNHVIVGAGPAGVVAAEALRKLQPNSSVTIIGDEPEPPYCQTSVIAHLVGFVGCMAVFFLMV